MTKQLSLIPRDTRHQALPASTIETGRRGIAAARKALASTTPSPTARRHP